jgi:hypothetical protein
VVDGLQDVDGQRKVKALWELAHRKLCVDINNKVEAMRKADTDLGRLVLELQASDVKPGWAMPLMNHARQVATDLENNLMETYRAAAFHEGDSVKSKVGKKESADALAETWTLFYGLVQKIGQFRQHVNAAHASVTQIN